MALHELLKAVAQRGEISLVADLDFWLGTTYQKDARTHSKEYLWPSTLSQCPRRTVYAMLEAPGEQTVGAKLQRVFDNGKSFHQRMQHYYQAMGKLSEEDTERRFTDEEHGIKGKTDGIVELADRRWILELKSMRSGRFKSLRQPPQPDLEQGMLYCHEFECSGVIFQYENKDDQDIKEFLVERNETVVQRMLDKADRIWACLRAQRLPPRDCRTSSEGRFCPYQAICFNDFFDLGGYWNGIRNSRRAAGSGV